MRIVSIFSKLLKTVGLLAVRLDLAELRWKNRNKISNFWQKSEFCIIRLKVFTMIKITMILKLQFYLLPCT